MHSAAYLAMEFAVLEGASLVFPTFGPGPHWFNGLVLVSVMGFPLALALAWTFEVTDGAIRRTAPTERGAVTAWPDRWARPKAALVGGGFVAIVWLGLALWQPLGSAAADAVPVDAPVLAVLPFDDFSPGGDQAYSRRPARGAPAPACPASRNPAGFPHAGSRSSTTF
jgi:hypothetical protein